MSAAELRPREGSDFQGQDEGEAAPKLVVVRLLDVTFGVRDDIHRELSGVETAVARAGIEILVRRFWVPDLGQAFARQICVRPLSDHLIVFTRPRHNRLQTNFWSRNGW